MARASVLVLTDLLTASRLPGLRVGRSAPGVVPAPAPAGDTLPSSDWNLDALAGRFVEISSEGASVALTATIPLLHESQLRGEPAAWVAIGHSTFYPPDLAESGCDLENLPVVRTEDARTAARAADLLLRSGGFRLVIIDGIGSPYVDTAVGGKGLPAYPSHDRASRGAERREGPAFGSHGCDGEARSGTARGRVRGEAIPPGAQSRLVGLAQKHRATLVCITRKERGASSLGALVSFRGTGTVRKTAFDRFTWELEVLKDKRRAPGWEHSGVCRGPTGLF